MTVETIATYRNDENAIEAIVFLTNGNYRVRIVDTDTGDVVPTIMGFASKDAAVAFAVKCAA